MRKRRHNQTHASNPPGRTLRLSWRMADPYWAERAAEPYYAVADGYVRSVAGAQSMLDVGCNRARYSEWWTQIPRRVAIDPCGPPSMWGVEARDCRLADVPTSEVFDVVVCLQVLEHCEITDPMAFCDLLKSHTSRALILSVPHLWPAGACEHHDKDPLILADVVGWMRGVLPVSRQVTGNPARLVCMFDAEGWQ